MTKTLTPVRAALRKESALHSTVENGLGALKKVDKDSIEDTLRSQFADSLALDEALRAGHGQESRWDYLLGHKPSQQVVGLEPHSAHSDQISTVIKKRRAAVRQLQDHLESGMRIAAWYWVASGKVDFQPLEKATLRLAQEGITFVGTRLRSKDLPSLPLKTDTASRKAQRPKRGFRK
jgi:hypothetical protein